MALDAPKPTNRTPQVRARRTSTLALGLASVAILLQTGCQSGGSGLFTRLKGAGKGDYANGAPDPTSPTAQPGNLLSRWLTPAKSPHTSDTETKTAGMVLGADGWTPMKFKPNPEADAELERAEKLAKEGRPADAEAIYYDLAKKRKGTPWGEKAQFLLAESQFKRARYVDAHDSYEMLIKDYPGTNYLDKLVAREYEIAQIWLADYDPNAKPEQKSTLADRVDGRIPAVDASGHALKTLEQVQLRDPNGPLADDAVLKTAEYYEKAGNYESAALYYDRLITDHPKSPHLHKAQLASIDAKLKGYYGPKYDGGNLESAKSLINQTMAAFPDRPANNEKLYKMLDVITDQEAERAFRVAEYYKKTGKVSSAEHYYGLVMAKWPKSEWAKKCKPEMEALAKMERKKWVPSTIQITPGQNDPFSNGGSSSSMGPNGMPNSF